METCGKLCINMTKKKAVLIIIAFVALVGILNCVMIEPALAYKEDPAASQTDEAHCCFICHSSHHQWIVSSISSDFPYLVLTGPTVLQELQFLIDPPAGSIFHPPLAF